MKICMGNEKLDVYHSEICFDDTYSDRCELCDAMKEVIDLKKDKRELEDQVGDLSSEVNDLKQERTNL